MSMNDSSIIKKLEGNSCFRNIGRFIELYRNYIRNKTLP